MIDKRSEELVLYVIRVSDSVEEKKRAENEQGCDRLHHTNQHC